MQICCNILCYAPPYFVMAVAASGSQNFPVPGCFQMLLPHLVPRQAKHKSKVKFFTRTKLSVKNFPFTCALDVLANNSGQVMSDSQRLPNNFVIVFCGLPRELYILKASEIKRSTFLKWNYRLSSLLCREIAHVLFILLEKSRKNKKIWRLLKSLINQRRLTF